MLKYLNESNVLKHYKLLNIVEFTSERKRMTVIVQDQGGKIEVITKGADTILFPLVQDN